jgi:hypothetical protein
VGQNLFIGAWAGMVATVLIEVIEQATGLVFFDIEAR